MGLVFLRERQGIACTQIENFAIDAGAGVAVAKGLIEDTGARWTASTRYRRQQLKAGAGSQGRELIGNLPRGLELYCAAALWAVARAGMSEENAKIVEYLGDGAHRRTGVPADGLLLDGDGRIKSEDVIDLRAFHLLQEAAGKGREALHVAAPAFGVERVEGQGGFAAAADARDDHELEAGNRDVDVLQVVLPGPANYDVARIMRGVRDGNGG